MKASVQREALALLGLAAVMLLCHPGGSTAGQAQQPSQPTEVHQHVDVTATALTPTRETSGTSWIPPVTPMYGLHQPWRGWDLRLNGALFVQVVFEPRDRHRTGGFGTRQVGALNWGMFAARRSVGEGRFGIRTMLSAEPWTVPNCGSLSFLSTGEVCEGDTVHDRQQPHDAFMELAVDYDRPIRGSWRWQIYVGLAGEPALGPPGYPHRPSATSNPMGPITHHWLDSTHVSFGVVTLGVNDRRWKFEASTFNGRAADESRADLDLGAFDSVSGRISFLPTERLAVQVSAARMRDAGAEFIVRASEPVTRLTASAMYHRPMGEGGLWATTVAVGANHAREPVSVDVLDATTSAALLESNLTLADRHSVFVRGEIGRTPAHHLHALEYSTAVFTVGKVQAGYVWLFPSRKGLVPGVGASTAVSLLPPELESRYSGRVAPSLNVFFVLRAGRHEM